MFFAEPGEYEPCQMYSIGHVILFTVTFIFIVVLLQHTKKSSKENIRKIIKNTTITLWILEIIKIIFNLAVGNGKNPNNYLPLYYCSIVLYAGLLSSYARGKLKRIGDIFIATGGLVGGTFFLCCPNTSLTMYPMFHYISIQSFIFHGAMVYMGILVNITNYINLDVSDIKYYAILVTIMISIAYIVNNKLDTNFMFISKDFPNTPVSVIYKRTGKFFTLTMSMLQIILPFFIMYIPNQAIKKSESLKSFKSKFQYLEKIQ